MLFSIVAFLSQSVRDQMFSYGVTLGFIIHCLSYCTYE